MAGVRDSDLKSLGPWPAGVNNKAAEDSLPKDEFGRDIALRRAVNMDLDKDGWPGMRRGRTSRVDADRAHSLFPTLTHLLAIVDSDLVAYDEQFAASTVRAAVGERYASFAQATSDIYWSNGLEIRRLSADMVDLPVWLATPRAPAVAAASSGGLAAGEYAVVLTWRSAEGMESGASPPSVVTVPENGGITVTNLPSAAAEGAATLRVYVTPPDGEIPYKFADVPATTAGLLIGAHTPGVACETQWMVPLPPGEILRFWNGRVLVMSRNRLCWSEPLRFGLMHQDSTIRFGEAGTLMEPVGEAADGAGVFVADHKRTYFLAGATPDKWERSIRYPHPAVPGTSITAPGTAFGLETTAPVAAWLAANGVFCVGLPGGQVVPIREGELSLDVGERGAAMFREQDGLRQLVTSFLTRGGNAFGVSDTTAATVRRHGVTTA
jgi:hypothetical protein